MEVVSAAVPGSASTSTTNSFTISTITRTLDIQFENLVHTVKTGYIIREDKKILRNISGDFRAGELTAIMGPSGVGKSTLMDLLSGYSDCQSGSIMINGFPIDLKRFRRQSAYIMQDDRLHPLLTVKEAMNFSANLKIGNELSKQNKMIRVAGIIKAIGLENAQKILTGELSGGQRKRLAIALELVNNPPVMFFDEPTTGLDSSMSFQCINLLKQLSNQGRTIVCTIHQPSALVFELFDQLYAIAEGQCIYSGSPENLVPFLNEQGLTCPPFHNPSDYLLEVATNDHGDEYNGLLSDKMVNGKNNQYRRNQTVPIGREVKRPKQDLLPSNEKLDSETSDVIDGHCHSSSSRSGARSKKCCDREGRYATSFVRQFSILLLRTFLILKRDPSLTTMRLGIHCAMAPLIGTLYFGIGNDAVHIRDNLNYVFYSIMFLMFTAFSAMSVAFPLELPIITREHFNRWYSLRAYYIAMTLADVPIQVACSLIYLIVTYSMTKQPTQFYRFGLFVAIILMVVFVAQALGLVVGALFSVKLGAIFGPFFICPFLIFSGYFIRLVDAHAWLQWLFHVSFLKYAFEGAAMSIFGYDRPKMDCPDDKFCYYVAPIKFLKDMGLENGSFVNATIALVVTCFVLRIFAFYIMSYRIKHKR